MLDAGYVRKGSGRQTSGNGLRAKLLTCYIVTDMQYSENDSTRSKQATFTPWPLQNHCTRHHVNENLTQRTFVDVKWYILFLSKILSTVTKILSLHNYFQLIKVPLLLDCQNVVLVESQNPVSILESLLDNLKVDRIHDTVNRWISP